MGTTSEETAAPPPTERKLFENVITRDGGKVTIDLDKLGDDTEEAVEVAGVLGGKLLLQIGSKAKSLASTLGAHIEQAHQEVKAKRQGGTRPDPPPAS